MIRKWRPAAKLPPLRRDDSAASSVNAQTDTTPVEASGEGVFFDGATAKPFRVGVRVASGRLLIDGPVQRNWDCRTLRASEALRPFMRVGPLGAGERLELTDEALGRAIKAAAPALRPRERIPYRLVGGILAAGATLLGFVVYGLPLLVDLVVPVIPLSFEHRVAEVAWRQLTRELLVSIECRVPAGQAALEQMVTSLRFAARDPALDLPSVDIDVRVVEAGVANAFALPGGHIVVTSQLIDRARGADELAGVIAHEMGHVAARDPTRLMLQNLGRSLLLGFFMGDMTGATVFVALGNEVVTARYSREAERAADAFATRTMLRAGADAAAFAGFLERIDPDDAGTPAFLRTHPFTRDRAQVMRAEAAAGRDTHPILDADAWAALKSICPPGRWPRLRVVPLPKQ